VAADLPWDYLIPGCVTAIKKRREQAGHDFIRLYEAFYKSR
jgi:hypothetical protein